MPPPAGPLCVHCRKAPVEPRWRSFCSERCRLLDLARWVDGEYRIPGDPVPDESPSGDPAASEP
jgi:endogenous inhibitor of DNA gyrase (YacG/DUF329 family)